MSVFYSHLRVPYDVCVKHIGKNMRKNLNIQVISQKKPDVVRTLALENLKKLQIKEMCENVCDDHDCLTGTVDYNGDIYTFKTHHNTYDAVLMLKKTSYPFDVVKIILPITTYHDGAYEKNTKIYIPEEFTEDKKVIPIEFVWEFLNQLPVFLKYDLEVNDDGYGENILP